jgi:hypothetical protein
MTIVLATIATIFLMMPGFAFVAGVNISDKTIREIVFRGTPAELAYIVAVSLVVHWVFAVLPSSNLNPANLVNDYVVYANLQASDKLGPNAPEIDLVFWSLTYFCISAGIGGLLGLNLGLSVRRWKWSFFVKHRWMLMLVGLSDLDTIYAYAVLTESFSQGKKGDNAPGDGTTVIEGWVRDSYFASDGSLLYLVFSDFQDSKVNLAQNHWLRSLSHGDRRVTEKSHRRLVLEGRRVAFVQYYERVPAPPPSDIQKAIAESDASAT